MAASTGASNLRRGKASPRRCHAPTSAAYALALWAGLCTCTCKCNPNESRRRPISCLLTGLALAHGHDTAFWRTAGMAGPAIPACASGASACPAAPATGRSAAVT